MTTYSESFKCPSRGMGRPQIVLYGNGLERVEGQQSWEDLLNSLCANGTTELTKNDSRLNIPFPLLYQLLSTPHPAPSTLTMQDINDEEKRLKEGLSRLSSNRLTLLDKLTKLNADHIFTTNYSYCLERSFFTESDFSKSRVRTNKRFCLLPGRNGKQYCETYYRLHTGYLAHNDDGSKVGLWHIHGEMTVPKGVIVGHDRYGRLLGRIQDCCASHRYRGKAENTVLQSLTSWPEIFLFGDVYIVGFGFYTCETDLWWLLRRKQREQHADGKVYFFTNDTGNNDRDELLKAHGVQINDGVNKCGGDYEEFYRNALSRIEELINTNRDSYTSDRGWIES